MGRRLGFATLSAPTELKILNCAVVGTSGGDCADFRAGRDTVGRDFQLPRPFGARPRLLGAGDDGDARRPRRN